MLPEKILGLTRLKLAQLLLRLGLAFIFLYAVVSATLSPLNWIGYFPPWARIFPEDLLLKLFSAGELGLALWLLSGWKLFYSAAGAALLLAAITLSNLSLLDVTFRDVGLVAAALALALLAD